MERIKKRIKDTNIPLDRNWWDQGINTITGYEIFNSITGGELNIENKRDERKYAIVYPSLSTIQNIQSKRLSDNIYDKRK
tara:strand:- start:234 stop:473 length:240 start_codon:yes stop_codon:yes gene_type:complete